MDISNRLILEPSESRQSEIIEKVHQAVIRERAEWMETLTTSSVSRMVREHNEEVIQRLLKES